MDRAIATDDFEEALRLLSEWIHRESELFPDDKGGYELPGVPPDWIRRKNELWNRAVNAQRETREVRQKAYQEWSNKPFTPPSPSPSPSPEPEGEFEDLRRRSRRALRPHPPSSSKQSRSKSQSQSQSKSQSQTEMIPRRSMGRSKSLHPPRQQSNHHPRPNWESTRTTPPGSGG